METTSRTKRIVGALAIVVAGGCMWEWDHARAHGNLTIDWYVNGSAAPSACASVGAAYVQTRIADDMGDVVAIDSARCDAYAMTFSIESGWYVATTRLFDARGVQIGATLAADVHVAPGATSTVDADFVLPKLASR